MSARLSPVDRCLKNLSDTVLEPQKVGVSMPSIYSSLSTSYYYLKLFLFFYLIKYELRILISTMLQVINPIFFFDFSSNRSAQKN